MHTRDMPVCACVYAWAPPIIFKNQEAQIIKKLKNECRQYLADVTPLPGTIVVDGSNFEQILRVGGEVVQLQVLLHDVPDLSTELCSDIVRRGGNELIEFHLKGVHVFCWACPVNLGEMGV